MVGARPPGSAERPAILRVGMANDSSRRFQWLPLVLLLISLAVFWVWPYAFPVQEPTLTGATVPSVMEAASPAPASAESAPPESPAPSPQTP